MQSTERHDLILQMLSHQEMVTVQELMNAFGVSIQTVRRDLNYLEQARLIKKVYGGAILYNRPSGGYEADARLHVQASEKEAIGRLCASLVNNGDSLYLGTGTTVRQVAKNLRNHKRLTILTPSLYVVMELLGTDIDLYLMGGAINLLDAHVATIMPTETWDFFHPHKAIIGAGGISLNYGVTDHNPKMAYSIKGFVERSMNVIVAADNSKFGLVGSSVTCPMARVSRIVTGSAKKEEILKDFPAYQQRFIFADDYTPDEPDLGAALPNIDCFP